MCGSIRSSSIEGNYIRGNIGHFYENVVLFLTYTSQKRWWHGTQGHAICSKTLQKAHWCCTSWLNSAPWTASTKAARHVILSSRIGSQIIIQPSKQPSYRVHLYLEWMVFLNSYTVSTSIVGNNRDLPNFNIKTQKFGSGTMNRSIWTSAMSDNGARRLTFACTIWSWVSSQRIQESSASLWHHLSFKSQPCNCHLCHNCLLKYCEHHNVGLFLASKMAEYANELHPFSHTETWLITSYI